MADSSAGPSHWDSYRTLRVVDPSPENWLSNNWDTTEEVSRVDHDEIGQLKLPSGWRWVDEEMLEIDVRRDVVFQDGELYDASPFKLAFDKVQAGPRSQGAPWLPTWRCCPSPSRSRTLSSASATCWATTARIDVPIRNRSAVRLREDRGALRDRSGQADPSRSGTSRVAPQQNTP